MNTEPHTWTHYVNKLTNCNRIAKKITSCFRVIFVWCQENVQAFLKLFNLLSWDLFDLTKKDWIESEIFEFLPEEFGQETSKFYVGNTRQSLVNFGPFDRIGRIKRSLSMFIAQIFHNYMRLRECKIAILYCRYCSLGETVLEIRVKNSVYLWIDFQVPLLFLLILRKIDLPEIILYVEQLQSHLSHSGYLEIYKAALDVSNWDFQPSRNW